MRALVTGAYGFVGRHLIQRLLESGGWEITGLGTRPPEVLPGVRTLACNLLDADRVTRVIEHYRPEVIFHLAAHAYVPQAIANPADTLINNAVGQVNLLEACRAAGIDPTIVVASSSEVYGAAPPERQPINEDEPFRPSNPYAVSKVTQDMLGLQYHLSYGMPIVRVRPFNHIGPGQNERFVVSSFARQIVEVELGRAEPVILVGNLEARRDFLDVRDVVAAYVAVAKPEFAGQVFNVARGEATAIQTILELLLKGSSADVVVRQDPSRLRPSDVPVLVGDASRLQAATGWRPEICLRQSLADTLAYWRSRLGSSSDSASVS